MPRLTTPLTAVHASFLTAMDELRAEGHGTPADRSTLGREMRAYGSAWDDETVFVGYIEALRAEREPVAADEPAPGRVPRTTLWYVEGDRFLGRIAIRHTLAPATGERDGHIGYYVRPSARGRGHAAGMLRAALPVARGLGISPALVTCDASNTASRRVIEACGGVLEDERHEKLRFLVPTGF